MRFEPVSARDTPHHLQELTDRTEAVLVRDFVLLQGPSSFTIADVRRAVPGISDNTIRLVLAELREAGRIAVDGTGRGATWRRT